MFYTTSDDGNQLFVDGGLVVNNDYVHDAIEESGSLYLAAGPHEIKVTSDQITPTSPRSYYQFK